MFRIGICDDETAARDSLRFQLENILDEREGEIVYEFSSGSVAVNWLKNHPGEIDLLFLDVEMPGENGMDTAGKIREFDKKLLIVFVTGYSDYVFDGYQVGALDYLMKPVKADRLWQLIDRVERTLGEQTEEMFVFRNVDGIYRMPLEEIRYFYSDRRKVSLVMREKEYSFYGKLDEVDGQLGETFIRIHQRYLVNPRWVEHMDSTRVTVNGQELPMSRSLKETAMAKLAKTMLENSC